MATSGENRVRRPLYVGLDEILVTTSTFLESIWLFVRHHPQRTFSLALHRLRGRAECEAYVCRQSPLDTSLLPYRQSVLDLLVRERASGRRVVLATTRPESIACAIADRLGRFDAVIAARPDRPLCPQDLVAAIREDAGGGPFDYVGGATRRAEAARVDRAAWSEATHAYIAGQVAGQVAGNVAGQVAGSREATLRWLDEGGVDWTALPEEPEPGRWPALRRAVRPHQWIKNTLIFVPIVLSRELSDPSRLLATSLAFLAFCAVASAGYLVNDLLDIESDRRHPAKCRRPIAAGQLSIQDALRAIGVLLAIGLGVSWLMISNAFTGMLVAYLLLTLAYSLVLKEKLFLDVLLLAGLYTHRVFAGGVAAGVEVSPWLLVFSVFFFMGLAILKRYVELVQARQAGLGSDAMISRRAYTGSDARLMEIMGIASGYVSVLVLALYTSRTEIAIQYSYPDALWLVLPLLIYWISRIWFLASRGDLPDDPVAFAIQDRKSYAVFAGILLLGLIASSVGTSS